MQPNNPVKLFAEIDSPAKHLVKILWSGFYFALAFILINYFDHFITSLCAALLDHDPVFSYNGVKPIAASASPWTLKRVAFIYLTAPLICLFISSALLLLLYKSYSNSHLSLFLFWLSLNAFALFYSYFFTGIFGAGKFTSIFFTGFSLFLSWFYFSSGTIILLLVLLGLFFSVASIAFAPVAMKYNYSSRLLKTKEGRTVLFVNTVLFPVIAGITIIELATYPLDLAYTFVRFCSISILLIVLFLAMLRIKKSSSAITQNGGIRYISPLYLLVAIALLAFTVRYGLTNLISL